MAGAALVLAAGRQLRWGGTRAAAPKQLLEVAGEPLIVRMQRQAASRGFAPVVATSDPALEAVAARHVRPERSRWTCETLLSCLPACGDEGVVVLLGDVAFSAAAMDAACSAARAPGRCVFLLTKKRCGRGWLSERVALSVPPRRVAETAAWCRSVVERAERDRCGAMLAHLLREAGDAASRAWTGDWTTDFDRPEDYAAFDQSLLDDLP